MKGAAALLWRVHPNIEAVLSTCCDASASTHSTAPRAAASHPQNGFEFEGPDNKRKRAHPCAPKSQLPIRRRSTPIQLRSVPVVLHLPSQATEKSWFKRQLQPTVNMRSTRQQSEVSQWLGRPCRVAAYTVLDANMEREVCASTRPNCLQRDASFLSFLRLAQNWLQKGWCILGEQNVHFKRAKNPFKGTQP